MNDTDNNTPGTEDSGMMVAPEDGAKVFPCSNEGIIAAQAYLETFFEDPKPAIIMDEILSNIVRCSGARNFSMKILRAPDGASMTFFDNGKAFDPTKEIDEPDISASAADRKIGGLGMFMVRKMSKSVVYERRDDLNVLTVTL